MENLEKYLLDDSPVGPLLISASPLGINAVEFLQDEDVQSLFFPERDGDHPLLKHAAAQLHEYFSGARNNFDLPLDLTSVSAFTRETLNLTLAIPWGEVISYGELARRLGKPAAARAVGGALGRNPIPIIIPCHRVVASDGSLHGYFAPGGLVIKERLLRLEGMPKLPSNVS
jgi:methylated-DNA-[protein]-cysteine S-methyltransferase